MSNVFSSKAYRMFGKKCKNKNGGIYFEVNIRS